MLSDRETKMCERTLGIYTEHENWQSAGAAEEIAS